MAKSRLELAEASNRTADFAVRAGSCLVVTVVVALTTVACGVAPAGSADSASTAPAGEDSLSRDPPLTGCVIYKDSDISEGQSIWDEFVAKSGSGQTCMVKLVFYRNPPDPSRFASPEAYDQAMATYQAYRLAEIRFDGNTYQYFSTQGGDAYSNSYKYLVRYSVVSKITTPQYSHCVYYALVNDNELTWEQIESSMFSSQSEAAIDYRLVYTDRP